MTPLNPADVPLPLRMSGFPRDYRGFVVPYFVAWTLDGKQTRRGIGEPDFRVVDRKAWNECVRFHHCWLCGQPLGRHHAFVLGPMCVITRTTSEPGSHRECAEYALRACPFLSRPRMRRNPTPWDGFEAQPAAGEHSDGNPGIMALWMAGPASVFRADLGKPGLLLRVGDPFDVSWWREGRGASREEVELGLAMAMPPLEASAAKQGRDAIKELEAFAARAATYVPRDAPPPI